MDIDSSQLEMLKEENQSLRHLLVLIDDYYMNAGDDGYYIEFHNLVREATK